MKVLLLGTDTLHRRYIISALTKAGHDVTVGFYVGEALQPKFDTVPIWEDRENRALNDLFHKDNQVDVSKINSTLHLNDWREVDKALSSEIEAAEIIVVSGAGKIKGELFDSIKSKAINIHLGIAEEYRGLDTNLWAWYHNDFDNIGVTLHEIDTNLDTGRIFFSETLSLDRRILLWNLRYFETLLAVNLLIEALDLFRVNRLVSREQYKLGRYYSFMPAVLKNYLNMSHEGHNQR